MLLHSTDYYCVFPPYGVEFRDMSAWLSCWNQSFRGEHRFWHGFSGGGLLAVPLDTPGEDPHSRLWGRDGSPCRPFARQYPYGTVLGNAAGEVLTRCVQRAIPDSPHALAVRMGEAEHVPLMTVAVTAEHAGSLGDDRRLLIVPKATRRRPLKLMERLPEWFAAFGVSIDADATQVPEPLRAEIQDWFGDPVRPMFALPMSGGEPNAAWQLAVTCYVAQYWETQARGLDSIHFVASIDGGPNFRKNWTSNR